MIIVFWIAFLAILGITAFLIVQIAKQKNMPRWGRVPTDNLQVQEVTIDAAGGKVGAHVYRSTDAVAAGDNMPGVIVLPPRNKGYPASEHWGAHFALQGFTTLCIDIPGVKLSREDFTRRLVDAFAAAKEILCKEPGVDGRRLAVYGEGDGAEAAVYAGAADSDVKCIIAFGMGPVDEQRAAGARGKVLLAHCQDDAVAPVDGFRRNCQVLGISDRDYLLLELGGHDMVGMEAVFGGFFSIKLHEKLKPAYRQVPRLESRGGT